MCHKLPNYLREIIDQLLLIDEPTRNHLEKLKFQAARNYSLDRIPSNSELIKLLTGKEREKLLPILRRKTSRSISGVNVVAVMTKPQPCPHGRCAYCPGGPEMDSPQSYTGHEPAAMRGSQNKFDPKQQVISRIKQLEAIGHEVDKIDLIIMGGTFPATSNEYQRWFVKECLDAITGEGSLSLQDAKLRAETSGIRNVGITVETRPDCLCESDIGNLLDMGVTRVEVGVQNVYDDVYNLVERGHTVRDVITGTRRLKDSALKVCYHMMPGLPGSDLDRDLEGFKVIFDKNDFKPDMLKIYPTLVVKGTKLYDWWRQGKYTPLTTEQAIELVSKVKQLIPPWIRVMRIQRDIPLHQIEAGVSKSNLRQLVGENLSEQGLYCRCIRCREVGHSKVQLDPAELEIIHREYEASEGLEDFISVEDPSKDVLVGFLRLRIPSETVFRPELTSKTGLIRELHVYGEMTPVGECSQDWQHRGLGEKLMDEAEKTSLEQYDMKHMVVMSALGTKEYYKRLGYVKNGSYVSKDL